MTHKAPELLCTNLTLAFLATSVSPPTPYWCPPPSPLLPPARFLMGSVQPDRTRRGRLCISFHLANSHPLLSAHFWARLSSIFSAWRNYSRTSSNADRRGFANQHISDPLPIKWWMRPWRTRPINDTLITPPRQVGLPGSVLLVGPLKPLWKISCNIFFFSFYFNYLYVFHVYFSTDKMT